MKSLLHRCMAVALATVSSLAAAQASVQVAYEEPLRFAEFAGSARALTEAQPWLDALQDHLQHEATSRLHPGQQLTVNITDLRRAGRMDPFVLPAAPPVRVLRATDTPQITLRYRLTGADGAVLQEGRSQLSDLGYLSRSLDRHRSDPLVYEKDLLTRWLQDTLGEPKGSRR